MESETRARVKFDAELFKVTGMDTNMDRLDIGMWLRMEWRDPNLQLCDCSSATDKLELESRLDLEGQVWMPDFAVNEFYTMTRTETGDFSLRTGVEESEGVLVSFSVDLRMTIACPLTTNFYPFDRNHCLVRVGSYGHTHDMVQFTRGTISSSNIKYKDLVVKVRYLCQEEAAKDNMLMDGFKIIFVREGFAIRDMYQYVMDIIVATAAAAILLPIEWDGVGLLDKSAPIMEASLVSLFLLFDLYSKAPQTSQGRDSIILSVEFGYLVVNVFGVHLLLCLFTRSLWASRVLGKSPWDRYTYNRIIYLFNKILFVLLLLIYVAKNVAFWNRREIDVDMDSLDQCTCNEECFEAGGH